MKLVISEKSSIVQSIVSIGWSHTRFFLCCMDKWHKNIVYNFRDCPVGNFLFRDQIILQQVNR